MNLEEAIKLADKRNGYNLTYYVIPWNDGYCLSSSLQIKRHPDMLWVYNSTEKQIHFDKIAEGKRRYEERQSRNKPKPEPEVAEDKPKRLLYPL